MSNSAVKLDLINHFQLQVILDKRKTAEFEAVLEQQQKIWQTLDNREKSLSDNEKVKTLENFFQLFRLKYQVTSFNLDSR